MSLELGTWFEAHQGQPCENNEMRGEGGGGGGGGRWAEIKYQCTVAEKY